MNLFNHFETNQLKREQDKTNLELAISKFSKKYKKAVHKV